MGSGEDAVRALDAPERKARVVPAPTGVWGLAVDAGQGVAFVAEHVHDQVHALALEDGREKWARDVDPNPREMVLWNQLLMVGSLQTGQVVLLDNRNGRELAPVVPAPGVPIIGGPTEAFSAQVMGGKVIAVDRLPDRPSADWPRQRAHRVWSPRPALTCPRLAVGTCTPRARDHRSSPLKASATARHHCPSTAVVASLF